MTGPTTPPAVTTRDLYGIDLASGDIEYNQPLVSIGTTHGHQLTASYRNFPGTDENSGAIDHSGDLFWGVVSWKVSVNGETEIFTDAGGLFTSTQGTGSTFVYDAAANGYKYTKRDGTVAIYSRSMAGKLGVPSNEGVLTSVTYPTGEKISYIYRTLTPPSGIQYVRLKSVVSNRGLMLKYSGQPDTAGGLSITAVNTAMEYCDPNAEACTGMALSWPKATMGVSTSTSSTAGGVNYYSLTRPVTNPLGKLSKRVYDQELTIYNPYGASQTKTKNIVRLIDEIGNSKVVTYNDLWTNEVAPAFSEGKVQNVVVGDTLSRIYGFNGSGLTHAWLSSAGYGSPGTNGAAAGYTMQLASHYVNQVSPAVVTINGNATNYLRDSFNRITQVTHPEGNIEVYTYDARGNVTQLTYKAKPGSGLSDVIYRATYPASCSNPKVCNQPTATFDAKNNETDYTYDPDNGQVLTVTMPPDNSGVRPQIRYHYTAKYARIKNSSGLPVDADSPIYVLDKISQCRTLASCTGGTDEIVTTFELSGNLYPTAVTITSAGVSTTTRKTYTPLGDVASVDGPLAGTGDTTYTTYDLLRRPVYEIGIDPDDAGALQRKIVYHVYNDAGQEIRTETGTGQAVDGSDFSRTSYVEVTYGNSGLKIKEAIYNNGVSTPVSVTQFGYDTSGRQVCSVVRMNPATFTALPANPCAPSPTIGTFGPDRVTQNEYNSASQLTAIFQAVGTSDLRRYAGYTFTNNGLKSSEIDANGNRTTVVYDDLDRLSTIQYPVTTRGAGTSSTADYEAFTYDLNGNRQTWRRRNGQTITYTYDKLNREVIADVPAHPGGAYNASEKDIYTTYDILGHVKKKAFGSYTGAGVSYTYNPLGWVATTTDMNNRTISYLYNAAGTRVQMTDASGYVVNYDLDNLNRVKKAFLNGLASVLYGYGYNNLGQRTLLMRGASGAGGTTTYAYDNLGRLQGIANVQATAGYDITWGKVGTVGAIAYNPANQITTWASNSTAFDYVETATTAENRTFDGLNRDAAIAAVSGGYDANGNLTKDAPRAFVYDIYNRLLTVSGGASNISLVYDPEGRLAKTTTATSSKDYLYDGTDLIAEYATGATTPASRYIFGSGTDDPVVWLKGADDSDRRYYYTNYQGSIIGYVGATGAFVTGGLTKYGAYGEPRNSANAETWSGTRFGYTGQMVLPEAYLYYYKARVYDPKFGRFLQTDPVGSEADLNLYAYVGGDPINRSDPTGLCPNSCSYSTQDKAGVAASNDDRARTDDSRNRDSDGNKVEYGGEVFRRGDGTFGYTQRRGDRSSVPTRSPPWFTTGAGDHHSHPENGRYNGEHFSHSDMEGNRNDNGGDGEKGYLSTPSGSVKAYDPNGSSNNQDTDGTPKVTILQPPSTPPPAEPKPVKIERPKA